MSLWWRLVRFGFRLLYNEMAFTYDLVSWVVSLGAWRCWQRTVLEHLPPNGRVLEIAHGTGNLQLDLRAAGHESVGADLSSYMGRITQRKLARQGITAQLVQTKAQHLPFPDASFPALVSTFPTNFIVDPESLREAYRVLAVDGCYVVVLNGVFTGNGVVQRFLEWLYQITGQREEKQVDLRTYFEDVGFEIEAVQAECPRSKAQLVIFRKVSNLT